MPDYTTWTRNVAPLREQRESATSADTVVGDNSSPLSERWILGPARIAPFVNSVHSEISGRSFEKAVIRYGHFENCTFTNCSFRDADLSDTRFSDCVLRNCVFTGTDLTYAVFTDGCDLTGSDFTGARLLRTRLPATFYHVAVCDYNADGYDSEGFDRHGYDSEGFDRHGFNLTGFNRDGYDIDGLDRAGWTAAGRDRDGYDRNGRDVEGRDRDGYDRNGNRCYCIGCTERYGYSLLADDSDEEDYDGFSPAYDDEILEDYSYRPEWNFHALESERVKGAPRRAYYGIEFEVSCSDSGLADAVLPVKRAYPASELLIFKEDGSVDGFEMVTHPMTYAWAMTEFPWSVLEQFENEGCDINTSSNGIHIHVSRKAFSNDAHMFRWMKFFYRNKKNVVRVAGRDVSWGKFDNSSQEYQYDHVMVSKLRRKQDALRGLSYSELYAASSEIDRQSQLYTDETVSDRYSAINTQNSHTLEVRVFASTLDPGLAKARFQFVAGSVEYTRQLTAADVIANGGWTWPAFRKWITDNKETYPDLAGMEAFEQERDDMAAMRREWLNSHADVPFSQYVTQQRQSAENTESANR